MIATHTVEDLKASVDLRLLVEQQLGSPATRGARAWNWPCPFHQEQRGASLAVWRDGWRCFGKCDRHGDAVDWLRARQALTFPEAVRALAGAPTVTVATTSETLTRQSPSEPPRAAWQQAAWRVVEAAERRLWAADGAKALAYLRGRGLAEDTIRQARLGFHPGGASHKLYAPRGILIPRVAGGRCGVSRSGAALDRPNIFKSRAAAIAACTGSTTWSLGNHYSSLRVNSMRSSPGRQPGAWSRWSHSPGQLIWSMRAGMHPWRLPRPYWPAWTTTRPVQPPLHA